MTFSDHKNQHIFLMRVHTYVHCTAVAYPSESIFQRKCYEILTIFKVLGNPKYIMSGPFGAIPSICFRGPWIQNNSFAWIFFLSFLDFEDAISHHPRIPQPLFR